MHKSASGPVFESWSMNVDVAFVKRLGIPLVSFSRSEGASRGFEPLWRLE
jgi:hypothetical protein